MKKGKRIYAEYNELKYEIFDQDGQVLYQAGNSPLDSQTYLSKEDGVGLETMKKYAIQTGKEIAKEHNGQFIKATYTKD